MLLVVSVHVSSAPPTLWSRNLEFGGYIVDESTAHEEWTLSKKGSRVVVINALLVGALSLPELQLETAGTGMDGQSWWKAQPNRECEDEKLPEGLSAHPQGE